MSAKNPVWKNRATVLHYSRQKCTVSGNPVYDIVFDIEGVGTRQIRAGYNRGFVYGLSLNNGNVYEIEWKRKGTTWDKFELLDATPVNVSVTVYERALSHLGAVIEEEGKTIETVSFFGDEYAYRMRNLEYKYPGYKYGYTVSFN